MRDRDTSWSTRARRVLAAAGLVSLATGVVLLLAPARTQSITQSITQSVTQPVILSRNAVWLRLRPA